MIDYVVFVDRGFSQNVYLCWGGGERSLYRPNGLYFYDAYEPNSVRFVCGFINEIGGISVRHDSYDDAEVQSVDELDCVGGLRVFYDDVDEMFYVVGGRENLLKVVNIFGELRGSGELRDVVLACCEVANL